jgi:hypothetical protein
MKRSSILLLAVASLGSAQSLRVGAVMRLSTGVRDEGTNA